MKKGSAIVVKANELINARYELSLSEQKLLLLAVSKVPHDKEVNALDLYEVRASDLMGEPGYSESHAYENLKAAAERLFERKFVIRFKEWRGKRQLRWVAECQYYDDQGLVMLRFTVPMLGLINEFKNGNFTQYHFKHIANMESSYGIRLYEWLCQWRAAGHFTVSLDEMKERLGVEGYDQISNFKIKILNPAVRDVKRYSDLDLTVKQYKEGRRIGGFIFTFTPKSTKAAPKTTKKKEAIQPHSASFKPFVPEVVKKAPQHVGRAGIEEALKKIQI